MCKGLTGAPAGHDPGNLRGVNGDGRAASQLFAAGAPGGNRQRSGDQRLAGANNLRRGLLHRILVPGVQHFALVAANELSVLGQHHGRQCGLVHAVVQCATRLVRACGFGAAADSLVGATLLRRSWLGGDEAHHGPLLIPGPLAFPEGEAASLGRAAGSAQVAASLAVLLTCVCSSRYTQKNARQ